MVIFSNEYRVTLIINSKTRPFKQNALLVMIYSIVDVFLLSGFGGTATDRIGLEF